MANNLTQTTLEFRNPVIEEEDIQDVTPTQSASKPITRLRYTKATEPAVANNSENKKYPKWVIQLQPFFEFVDFTGKKSGTTEVVMKCKECLRKTPSYKGITGRGTYNFTRHLETHPEQWTMYLNSNQGTTAKSKPGCSFNSNDVISFPIQKVSSSDLYKPNDSKQMTFENNLTHFIVTDSVPFSIVDLSGFRNLVHSLDPKLRIPCRKTVVKKIILEHDKIMRNLQAAVAHLPERSCHLLFDIWSTRQKESVIGVELRYIKNWKLFKEVLLFKSFSDSHTAQNIKTMISTHLSTIYKIKPEQIASSTTDNASNVLAALRVSGIGLDLCGSNTSEDESPDEWNEELADSNKTLIGEEQEDDIFDFLDVELRDEDDAAGFEVELQDVAPELDTAFKRNGCLAHLLQLAIKDGLKSCNLVQATVRKVNNIVNYFHSSNKWYSNLRERIGGLSLLKPCRTRWNSLYHCLKRLVGENREQIDIFGNINCVLGIARREARGKQKKGIPQDVTDEEILVISFITLVLEPFAELTDDLQADGVTSSLVILGLLSAIKRCTEVQCEEELADFHDLRMFRNNIIDSVITRFATNQDNGEFVFKEGKQRRIVTIDAFSDETFVLATLLDPRIKTTAFRRMNSLPSKVLAKLPNETAALEVLRRHFTTQELSSCPLPDSERQSQAFTADSTPEPKRRKAVTMFDYVEEVAGSTTDPSAVSTEIEEYLKLPLQSYSKQPLNFWNDHEKMFPILATLARRHLAVPATSGSVERLFSIAGALGRSRRSRITVTLLEKVLMIRQHLLNSNL